MIPCAQSKGGCGYHDVKSQNSSSNFNVIRITALMFKKSIINKDGNVIYNSSVIRDCMVVGYLVNYKELRECNKIIITLWDHTGQIRILFHYSSEEQFGKGVDHIEKKFPQPVQAIGILRGYKQEKQFIGCNVVKVKDISVFCHYFELIREWLYLTKERVLENTNDSV